MARVGQAGEPAGPPGLRTRRGFLGAALSWVPALVGCAARSREPARPVGDPVWVSLRVTEAGHLVLIRDGWLRAGEPIRVRGRGRADAPGVVVDLLVQPQAARSGAYSARLAVSLEGAVLAAPVLTLLPERPAAVDVVASDRTFHLELTLAGQAPAPSA